MLIPRLVFIFYFFVFVSVFVFFFSFFFDPRHIMPVGSPQLINELESAHASRMISVKAKATYDASTNRGKMSLEVLLLPKVRTMLRGALPMSF